MKTWKQYLVFLILFAGGPAAYAGHVSGRVYEVRSGDTIYVLDGLDAPYVVRIAGISAPAVRCCVGKAARSNLVDLVFHKHVEIYWQRKESDGTLIGKVVVQWPEVVCYEAVCPGAIDVGLQQINAGLARQSAGYQAEQSLQDQAAYSSAMGAARAQGAGVWFDSADAR